MIRLSDAFTVKDAAGTLYATANLLLSFETGGKLYEIAGKDDQWIVSFSGADAPTLHELRKMGSCQIEHSCDYLILWPKRELYALSSEQCCGFLAQKDAVAAERISLSQMIRTRKEHPDLPSAQIRPYLIAGLHFARCIDAIHSTPMGYVIGAFDPREFEIDSRKKVYYFCAYDCGRSRLRVKDYRYLAPELIACPAQIPPFSKTSDAFAFALILFELITGRYPFADVRGEALQNGELEKAMLDGESIYYQESSPACVQTEQFLLSISRELAQAFRDTFDYCGAETYTADRPSLKEWISLLERTLVRTDPFAGSQVF